jgi:alpha-beta hydrolase superfamily lysophospholipase
MKPFKLLLALALSLSLSLARPGTAQDFLASFGGNADSLRAYATRLIQQPAPAFRTAPGPVPGPAATPAKAAPLRYFTARDQQRLAAYRYAARSPHTILLLHGVATDAAAMRRTAGRLRQATGAQVYVVDLRGHGRSAGRPGDVAYIGQYADDVADIVAALRRRQPKGKIILAGHSMGGGVALRYALQARQQPVDGFLLFAPLLGHDSPAFQAPPAAAGPAAATEEPFLQVHLARIIGLKMLNSLHEHRHDSLPVLFFHLPAASPLRHYSYRANQSMAPEHYAEGLRAVQAPLLVLVGSRDEAFSAVRLRQAVLDGSRGEVGLVEGATHEGLLLHPQAFELIRRWFVSL